MLIILLLLLLYLCHLLYSYHFQELMDIKENTLQSPYFLFCKFKGAKLLGFIWTGNNEILLISDKGVELYQVK